MIVIYDYIDATDFLNDKINELKKSNPAVSLRYLAGKLHMKSHGPLHAILNKQRKIPKKILPLIIKVLKLTNNEAKFFEVLVDYQRSKSNEEKEFYLERLNKLAPGPLRKITDIDVFKSITDPLHIILSELTQLRHYEHNPVWIKQHLRVRYNLRDIELAMARLEDLGLIKVSGKKVIKPIEHIYTELDIPSAEIQKYHREILEIAAQEVSKQNTNEKEFNSITFNIDPKDLPKIKEDIRSFINDIVDKYESDSHKGKKTYQLSSQLFSLLK